ncbi:uncharacterized protein I303_105786 [Kwoniella dejecticola CBS 10117]|uniref:Uncharacterized protein n=1 Tax=Kwoniella dejecticola CBS 10117 TaxID=1296121 RepID=A0A1A6A0G3_9TREE|nr:uncharacterized protein I303_05808 [Kwoniella dejecticola CBS 10117]OBR83528.1 hypothetical protein I303_05808 [Kwoniella dejecticola CBS 10117]
MTKIPDTVAATPPSPASVVLIGSSSRSDSRETNIKLDLAAALDQIDILIPKLKETEWQRDIAKDQFHNREERHIRLTQEIDQLRAEVQAWKTDYKHNTGYQEQLKNQANQLTNAQHKMDDLQSEVKALKGTIQEKDDKIQMLERVKLVNTKTLENRFLNNAVAEYQGQLRETNQLRMRIMDLKAKLELLGGVEETAVGRKVCEVVKREKIVVTRCDGINNEMKRKRDQGDCCCACGASGASEKEEENGKEMVKVKVEDNRDEENEPVMKKIKL